VEFKPFPKLPRLYRDMVITEKLDGTNACVVVQEMDHEGDYTDDAVAWENCEGVWYAIYAQSRKRFIVPGKSTDNYGFANWVADHADELVYLGAGRHYGEWWGKGIQRGYDLDEKRFSLFNPDTRDLPDCCSTVPVLSRNGFDLGEVKRCLTQLRDEGSAAAPGFDNPEGVVVYHTAARLGFKVTLDHDEMPKSLAPVTA